MALSKVYFTDFHASFEENLLQKLARLARTAGMESFLSKPVYRCQDPLWRAGQPGLLRPNYARVLVDMVKRQGGRYFYRLQHALCWPPEKRLGSSRCRL